MYWQPLLYIATALIAAAISAALAGLAWYRRSVRGAKPFALLMLAIAVWLVGNALETSSVHLATKVFWANVQYFGIVVVPVAWLAFALQYAGRHRWLTRRNLLLLLASPAVTVVLIWTNPAHGLFRSAVSLNSNGPFPALDPTRGPWFGVHTVYSYLLLLLGTALLIQRLIDASHLYRGQIGALLIGVLAPWLGNVVFIAGFNPLPNGDPIPFTFTVGGLAIAWSLFHFRLFDLAPVARDALIEGMSDALIVLDEQDRIVDLNPAAQQIIEQDTIDPIGQPVGQVFPDLPVSLIDSLDEREEPAEIALGKDPQRFFDVRSSPLHDQRERLTGLAVPRQTGRLVVLRDITQRVEAEEALLEAREELELRVKARTAELAKVNRQLQTEIAEREQIEQALREREKRFRVLIENAPDGVALLGADGKFQYLGPSTKRILGYDPEEDENGRDPAELTHPEDLPDLLALLDDLQKEPGKVVTTQYRFRHKDGSWRWLESTISNLLAEPSVNAIVFNYRDITERKQAAEALRQSEERFRALIENALDIISVIDEKGTIQFQSPSMEHVLGFSLEEHIGQNAFELIHPDDLPEVRKLFEQLIQEPGATVTVEYRMQHRDGSWRVIESIGRNSLFNPSVQGVVINSRDITERKRAEERVQRLANKLKSIARPARQMASLLDPDQLVQQVVRSLQEITGCYNANFFLLEEDDLVLAAGRGGYVAGNPPLGHRLPLGKGIIGRVAQTGQPLLVPDVNEDEHYEAWEGLPHTRSELAVPVKSGDRLLGVIDMQATVPESFDAVDLEALGVLADQLAVALENARLYEEAQRRLRQVQALRDIDMAITASRDLRQILNVCLEQAIAQLGVDAADVLLLKSQTQSLAYAAGRGFRTGALQHTHLQLGEGHAGRAALKRRLIHIPNLAETENGFKRSTLLANERFVAYYGVPLVAKGRTTGVLEIFHREALDPDAEWMGFLETLAGQVAIAIENASLFEDLERSNLELARAYDTTLEGWARALELRDIETEGHSRRVTEATLRLAREMGLREEQLTHMRRGALLHDIGKMGVPDSILFKPGELTEKEWAIMRRHPVYAYELLSPIDFLRPALDIPYCHHEKWDGTGYPRGLKGEQIPLAARIFAVADVYDALTSDRPYRDAWSEEKAIEYVREQAGQHFDPHVTKTFLDLQKIDG